MKKKNLVLGFMLVMLLAMNASSLFAFAGGDGSAEHPYQVSNATELNDVRNYLSSYFIQTADIDLNVSPYNTGDGWVPIGNVSTKFTGTFDGNGYKITNLFINRPLTSEVGLFGYTAGGSEIKNVSLEGVNVSSGYNHVGGLVGVNDHGTITNSYSTGSVSDSDSRIGGFVGWFYGGTITNSYSTCSVSGTSDVGGLVGYYSNGGTITNSYSTGSVSGTSNVGGLVGYYSDGGTTTSSYWDTETSGQSSSAGGTGKTTAEMTTGAH